MALGMNNTGKDTSRRSLALVGPGNAWRLDDIASTELGGEGDK